MKGNGVGKYKESATGKGTEPAGPASLGWLVALELAFTGCWPVQCSNCLDVYLENCLDNCMFACEWLDYTFDICRPWLQFYLLLLPVVTPYIAYLRIAYW